jgi:hypothetical protein
MKKTNKKVEVMDGQTKIIRCVYVDEFGKEFFKHGGENNYIYPRENGRYNAPYYNGVKYI